MGLFLGLTIGPIIGALVSMLVNYLYIVVFDRDNEMIGLLLFVLCGILVSTVTCGICNWIWG